MTQGNERQTAKGKPPHQDDAPTTDTSAAEDSRPADMDYYRVAPKSGAMMMLGTVAIPVAVIVLILVAVMIMT